MWIWNHIWKYAACKFLQISLTHQHPTMQHGSQDYALFSLKALVRRLWLREQTSWGWKCFLASETVDEEHSIWPCYFLVTALCAEGIGSLETTAEASWDWQFLRDLDDFSLQCDLHFVWTVKWQYTMNWGCVCSLFPAGNLFYEMYA